MRHGVKLCQRCCGTRLCQSVCELRELPPAGLRVYSKLNKLLKKGELKPFVQAHCEFACQDVEGNMLITWSDGAAPSSASAHVADAERDSTWECMD